jgi:hypothetical protein
VFLLRSLYVSLVPTQVNAHSALLSSISFKVLSSCPLLSYYPLLSPFLLFSFISSPPFSSPPSLPPLLHLPFPRYPPLLFLPDHRLLFFVHFVTQTIFIILQIYSNFLVHNCHTPVHRHTAYLHLNCVLQSHPSTFSLSLTPNLFTSQSHAHLSTRPLSLAHTHPASHFVKSPPHTHTQTLPYIS